MRMRRVLRMILIQGFSLSTKKDHLREGSKIFTNIFNI